MNQFASFHPEAQQELIDATMWYDDRQEGLGDNFIDAVSAQLVNICQMPGRFQPSATMSNRLCFVVFLTWFIFAWLANEFSFCPFSTQAGTLDPFGHD